MPNNEDQKIVIYWSTKKTISLICAVLLIPMFIIFVFSATLKTTILNKNYYLDNLKKVDAYNRLINDGIPSLILDTKISDNKLTDSFAKELAIFVIQKSVDPAWVEDQTGKLVDKIAELLANPKSRVSLDLSGTKDLFGKVSAGLLIFDNMIPACEDGQKIGETQTMLGQVMDAKTNCEVKADLAGIRNQIDKINIGVINLDNDIKSANSFIESVQRFTSNIKIYFWFSLISLIILLGTIVILEFYDLAFVVKSISAALMIASGVAFFGGLIAKALISTAYIGVSTDLSGPIEKIIGDFTAVCVRGIFSQLEITSAIIFGIFLALFIATIFLEKSGSKLFKRS